MKFRISLLQDYERDQHAVLAMAQLVTKAPSPHVEYVKAGFKMLLKFAINTKAAIDLCLSRTYVGIA